MDNQELQEFFCPACHRKVFHGNFYGTIEIKCYGCKSVVLFDRQPRVPVHAEALEKISELEEE